MAQVIAQEVTQVCPMVARPSDDCAWCWPHLHPAQPYPAEWSSTICQEHSAWMQAQAAARRERQAWQRAFELFLAQKFLRSHSEETERIYRSILTSFFVDAQRLPSDYCKEEVLHFIHAPGTKGKPPSQAMVNLRLSVLAGFYKWAREYSYRGVDSKPTQLMRGPLPTANIGYGKVQTSHRALTIEEVKRFFAVLPPADTERGARDRAIFVCLLYTARRKSELTRLKWGDIKQAEFLHNGVATPGIGYFYLGKGRTVRSFAEMPAPAYAAIVRYLEVSGRLDTIGADEYVFCPVAHKHVRSADEAKKPISDIWPIFARYAKLAKLDMRRLCVHSWRDTSALHRRLEGADIVEIKELLDHSSLATTYIYVKSLEGTGDTSAPKLERRFSFLSEGQP